MRTSLYNPPRWSPQRLRFMTADAGAAGTPGVTPPAAPASPPAAPASPPAAPATPPAVETPPKTDGDEPWADPTKAKAEIERLRRENGAERTNAKKTAADEARAELAQTIGKALGIVKGDEPADPAELAKQVAASKETARAAQVELAVYRGAGAHQGNPDALLDSRSFLAKVAELDPADADFQKKVSAAIKTAVTENAQLKVAQGVARSGVGHTGGTGEATDIDAQIAAATAAGDHRKAIALKRAKAAGTTTS